MNPENERTTVWIKIPFKTFLAVLVIIVLAVAIKILAELLMTLFLATLVATSLMPVLNWMEHHKVPRWLGITLIATCLSGAIIGFFVTIMPKLFQEVSIFVENLPKLKEQMMQYLSPSNPIRPVLEENMSKKAIMPDAKNVSGLFAAGNVVFGGLLEVVFIFVFGVYLLSDGPRILEWSKAFFQPATQEKIDQTFHEVSKIIFSYVSGVVISSVLCFGYVLLVMSILHVPNRLLIAVIAGVFDILPVLGLFVSIVPAVLFGLTVSVNTALIIVGAYLVYHALENYFILPALYGKRLRMPSIVILVSLIAGGLVGGVEGAIAILPVVASYPIIEKIWLKKVVRSQAISEHNRPKN